MTVCSYIEHKEKKKHEGMSQTQAVAGINSLNSKSLESSDSVQQNEGARGARKTTGGKGWQAYDTVLERAHVSPKN